MRGNTAQEVTLRGAILGKEIHYQGQYWARRYIMRGNSGQGGTLRKAIVGKEIYNKVNTEQEVTL